MVRVGAAASIGYSFVFVIEEHLTVCTLWHVHDAPVVNATLIMAVCPQERYEMRCIVSGESRVYPMLSVHVKDSGYPSCQLFGSENVLSQTS